MNAKDETGNISPTFEYIISRFDETAPTVPQVTGNPDGWSQTDITITALSTDEQSGVAAYSFSTEKGVYNWHTENVKTFTESATVYDYDDHGRLIRTNDTDYFYDSNGNCIRTDEYDAQDELYHVTYYVYDQKAMLRSPPF